MRTGTGGTRREPTFVQAMTDQWAWRAVRDSRTPVLNGSDLRGDPKGPLFRMTGRGMLEETAAKRDHLSSRTTQLYYRRLMKLASMARANANPIFRVDCFARQRTNAPFSSAVGGASISLANGVGDTFRSHYRGVLAIGRDFTMIAGAEGLRPAVSANRDLATVNHDPHVEVVRMHVLGKAGLLAAVNDLPALAEEVALKAFAGKRPAVAAAT